jgi:glutaminyl-peptide cyclotransferase
MASQIIKAGIHVNVRSLTANVLMLLLFAIPTLEAQPKQKAKASTPAQAKAKTAPVFGYHVKATYPHDRNAFTEGFFYLDGFMYEGTGLEQKSDIRRYDLETGKIAQRQQLAPQYFGEGIAILGGSLFELTYKTGVAFVYDSKTFQYQKQFQYSGEGWGLTTDGKRLIMSDGTEFLRFLDPLTFKESRRIAVTDAGKPVQNVNELEFIKGEIWANVWQTNRIARINPQTGQVVAWLDLTGILSIMDSRGVDVLNGIAYDAKRDRIFVTGKNYPKIYEITVAPKR